MESESFLAELNQRIRRGCTAHLDPNAERIYYLNHETRTSSWLPPVDSWSATCTGLPYGWEAAVDKEGRSYFINHVSKTTTYEDPRKDYEEEPPPCPREVELFRDPQLGFGFVAGSEKPVIVRFVTEGGPSEHKLQPGDQILGINGEDVKSAPREHVIELVKSCRCSVKLVVCQPHTTNTTRKSALLTAAKKAKLKSNPSRVRFAEGVVINGSPLYCPSTFESCVPFMPNVMKVFMENGQTKSFKYDSSTTVQDVLNSLQEKLSVKCMEHFGLVVEHIKSVRRNKLTLLDPKDSLAKIAARPGAHHLRCLFRVAFVPLDSYDLLQKDPIAFEYLYVQCCNDMVQERFAPELKYDVALRLAALHIQLHALSSGMQGKMTIKSVERECGLKRFVPASLLETMKRKELRKLLGHYLKQNQALSAPGQKQLTALQAKLHYLKIVGELPSYGAKCFSTLESETAILVSPKFGLSQINNVRSNVPTQPVTLAHIAQVSSLVVRKDDDTSYSVEIKVKDPDKESLKFSLEDNDMAELVFILKGYHKLLASRDLPVDWEVEDTWKVETAPCFHGPHVVCQTSWSYPPWSCAMPTIDLSHPPPPYVPCELPDRGMSRSSSREQCSLTSVDHNMNEMDSAVAGVELSFANHASQDASSEPKPDEAPAIVKFDIMDDDDEEEEQDLRVVETKNSQVLRRVSEMRRIVSDAENYLSERKISDTAEPQHDQPAEVETVAEVRGQIKAADSLLLLTQLDVQEAVNDVTVRSGAENESPSESDTDSFSTPNQSPLHRASRLAGAVETAAPRARSGSSFGLHSPDVLPGLGTGDKELLELLKKLQSNPDIQLPFAEGTLYLDPDIIDLTMIPPPMTPDTDLCDAPGAPDVPPTLFSDKRPSLSEEKLDADHEEHADSARVVAELDSLCNALTELHSSGDDMHYQALFEHLGCEDLDSFIATATIPPPPEGSHHCTVHESDDDIASYIIPPPPPSCNQSTEVQNQVLARFQRASEDIRRIMSTEEPGKDTSRHSAAMEPPLLESLKVCDVLTNGGYGGLLVTDGEALDEFPQRDLHCVDVANGSMDKPQVPPRLKKSMVNKKEGDGTEPRVARSLSWTNLEGQAPPSPKARKPPLPIQQEQRSNSNSPRRLTRVGGSPQLVRKRSPARSASLGRAAGRALNGFAPLHPALNCLNTYVPLSDLATCKDGPYARAQEEVYAMVMRLDQVAQTAPVVVAGPACKEALLAESRQFVTASKLFVKSATEASDDTLDHLVTCVALLDRMFAAGEALVVTRPTLCEQLKAVALAYARTVGTAGCGDAMSSLMCQATDLASVLTTLMRTLRSVECP